MSIYDSGKDQVEGINVPFLLLLLLLFFYYSYVHTRLGSFLPPAPTPSLTTHSAPSLSPHQYPAVPFASLQGLRVQKPQSKNLKTQCYSLDVEYSPKAHMLKACYPKWHYGKMVETLGGGGLLVGPKVTEDRSLKAIVELSPFFSYRL
jgi:energy-converting hydrogenase Eha subunit F